MMNKTAKCRGLEVGSGFISLIPVPWVWVKCQCSGCIKRYQPMVYICANGDPPKSILILGVIESQYHGSALGRVSPLAANPLGGHPHPKCRVSLA